jgi:hypothetical protein
MSMIIRGNRIVRLLNKKINIGISEKHKVHNRIEETVTKRRRWADNGWNG